LNLLVRVGWFFEALPQDFVWILLVVVLGFLTLRLAGKRRPAMKIRTPVAEPTPSDLAELVHLVRRAEVSSSARRELGRRLAGAAVAMRVRREAIRSRQAWDDLEGGRWPRGATLRAVLHPGHGWNLPLRHRDYSRQLQTTVDALWLYAQGGDFEDT
jgi:hypothetical protein